MAWTTPMTFTAGSVLTAAQLNTHLRDNLNETCAATVTTAGDLAYADAANSMNSRLGIGAGHSILAVNTAGTAPIWRAADADIVTTSQTTTSTSYTDLTTSGPAVTVTTGSKAFVTLTCQLSNSTAGARAYMSFAVSGASSISADDQRALWATSSAANQSYQMSWRMQVSASLTAGSNTFTAKYRVSSGTGTFVNRRITVEH